MSSETIYYIYLIEDLNPPTEKYLYLGKRKTNLPLELDPYMGSSKDKEFRSRLKSSPSEFKRHILSMHSNEIELSLEEIRLHELYNVDKNPAYYNKQKQKSTGFDATGFCAYRHIVSGEIEWLSTDDYRVLDGTYVGHLTDIGNYKHNITGISKSLSITDPLVLDGTYVGITTGYCIYKHSITGERKYLPSNHKSVLDGTFIGNKTGYCSFKNKLTGEISYLPSTHQDVLDGTVIGLRTGKATYKHHITGDKQYLSTNDPLVLDGTYIGLPTGITIYKDYATGKHILQLMKTDPRVISGEYVGFMKKLRHLIDQ